MSRRIDEPRINLSAKGNTSMLTLVTARDVPEIRARMAAWARDPGTDGATNWFTFWLGPHPAGVTESRVFDHRDDVSAIYPWQVAGRLEPGIVCDGRDGYH